jgi:CBS-domain-containing membrane protein
MAIKSIRRHDQAIPGGLTAEHVMDRNCLIIPQQMLVREAVRLLHEKRSHVAAVVDTNGRCVGTMGAADVFRWIEAYCPEVTVRPGLACPYQVRGRLLNGDDAVICSLAHGSCTFQAEQPTTGGRHTDVCSRPERGDFPFGAAPRYMTTNFASITSRSNLSEMVQRIVDTGANNLVVLDKFDRPAGIVSATDVLSAVVERIPDRAKTRTRRITAQKPR